MATSDRLLPQRSKDGTKVKGRHEGGRGSSGREMGGWAGRELVGVTCPWWAETGSRGGARWGRVPAGGSSGRRREGRPLAAPGDV